MKKQHPLIFISPIFSSSLFLSLPIFCFFQLPIIIILRLFLSLQKIIHIYILTEPPTQSSNGPSGPKFIHVEEMQKRFNLCRERKKHYRERRRTKPMSPLHTTLTHCHTHKRKNKKLRLVATNALLQIPIFIINFIVL